MRLSNLPEIIHLAAKLESKDLASEFMLEEIKVLASLVARW